MQFEWKGIHLKDAEICRGFWKVKDHVHDVVNSDGGGDILSLVT